MSSDNKGSNRGVDDEGYIPLIDYIPYIVSKKVKDAMAMCKTEKERQIWDAAIKECIKATVLDAGGFPGPQIMDMKWLLFDDEWDWHTDKEFLDEIKERNGEQ